MSLTNTEIPSAERLLAPGGYAARIIRRRAMLLSRMGIFGDFAREDIEQELSLRLLRRLRNYNPDKSTIRTFVFNSLRYETKELVRSRYAKKHIHWRQVRSLDTVIADEDSRGQRLTDIVSRSEQVRGSGRTLQDDQEQFELRHDLQVVLAKMPRRLRAVCKELLSARDPASAKRRLPPQIVEAIKQYFTDAGLDGYL